MTRFVLIAGFLAAVAGVGCHRSLPAGGATNSKAEQARRQAEGLALNVVNSVAARVRTSNPRGADDGGAVAQATVIGIGVAQVSVEQPGRAPTANTRVTFRPGSPPALKERVSSSFPAPTEADAEEDALLAAQEVLARKLAEMDPPVYYRPSVNEVKNEFLRRTSRTVRPVSPEEWAEFSRHGIDPNRVYVEYEIEMSADQLRALRTRNRLADALQLLPVAVGVLVIGFGFLRLDSWTKGNMTRWLAIVAGIIGGGAAAVWYFA